MGRPKKASATIDTVEQANAALHSLLCAQVELEKYVGAADLARAAATAKYETAIDGQRERIADLTLQLQTFYMANYKALETEGRKSVQLTYGVLGRRMGKPTLKPLNRSWTWAAVKVKLREAWAGKFFRAVEPEVDKDLIKADLTAEQLRDVGLKVEQDEAFFVEVDRSKLGDL